MHAPSVRTLLASALVVFACTGCSSLSKNTIAGAGLGGVAGAVLTGGSPAGAALGAVVGGVVGDGMDQRRK